VEIDGCYVGGHIRPEKRKEDRKDRCLAENQTGTRQVVVVRERGDKTMTMVFGSEDESAGFIKACVDRASTAHADESAAWNALHARFAMKRINHQDAYSADGARTNQAESYFARLRRARWGKHHRARQVPGPLRGRDGVARGSPLGEQRGGVSHCGLSRRRAAAVRGQVRDRRRGRA
jgi:hypothetical protein